MSDPGYDYRNPGDGWGDALEQCGTCGHTLTYHFRNESFRPGNPLRYTGSACRLRGCTCGHFVPTGIMQPKRPFYGQILEWMEHYTPEQRVEAMHAMRSRWCWDCGRAQQEHDSLGGCPVEGGDVEVGSQESAIERGVVDTEE